MAAKAAKSATKGAAKKATAKKVAASQVMSGRSAAWMAAVAASLERDTGKNLDQMGEDRQDLP